jgi:hypothetical protein
LLQFQSANKTNAKTILKTKIATHVYSIPL